ncbi:MAG: electron transfer flavoprotein subunit beta/FixA family protein [Chloroflexi bacterium]|nr:electron transfer flavoprotein subunit beta/FixA family protein [Chloroflexota bacterium]
MPLHIIVCVKQVLDPETPASALRIDPQLRRMVAPANVPPVVNGFDENAVEAALRIKDARPGDVKITVLSCGKSFAMEVIKKPLSMGCDELVLLQDNAFDNLDAFATAHVLAAAIKKLGAFDIVLCGRQASDWDQAQVPQGLAQLLGLPGVTIAKKVEVTDKKVRVERVVPGGREVVEASLPALITVTNELGQPRYPNLRGIMAATRKQPVVWKAGDLGLDPALLQPAVELQELFIPVQEKNVEIIEGEDDADKGRKLALKLREAKLI